MCLFNIFCLLNNILGLGTGRHVVVGFWCWLFGNGRCFCFWWPWDWKVPSDIPELKKFNLSAACAGVLQDIRCAYILQLMVTLVSKTAKNLLPIFDALRGNDRTMLTKCLRDLDTCMLSQEALCIGWTKGLEQLLNTRSISAHSVLVELKIKPVTPAALHLLGSGNQTSSENLGDTSDGDAHGDQPICLTINELLLFGSEGNDVVGTDQLHCCNWLCRQPSSMQPLSWRTPGDPSWRLWSCLKMRRQPRVGRVGRPKSELLLRIDDPSSLMRSAQDPQVQLYRLPDDFELAFQWHSWLLVFHFFLLLYDTPHKFVYHAMVSPTKIW